MNRVKMLSTQYASDDGLNASYYIAGETYDISDKMLAAFISIGAVELVEDKAIHDVPEHAVIKRGRPRK